MIKKHINIYFNCSIINKTINTIGFCYYYKIVKYIINYIQCYNYKERIKVIYIKIKMSTFLLMKYKIIIKNNDPGMKKKTFN